MGHESGIGPCPLKNFFFSTRRDVSLLRLEEWELGSWVTCCEGRTCLSGERCLTTYLRSVCREGCLRAQHPTRTAASQTPEEALQHVFPSGTCVLVARCLVQSLREGGSWDGTSGSASRFKLICLVFSPAEKRHAADRTPSNVSPICTHL